PSDGPSGPAARSRPASPQNRLRGRSPRSNRAVWRLGGSYAADAGGAEVVADVENAGDAGGGVVGQRGVDACAGGGANAFVAQHMLEGAEAEQDVLSLRRVSHGADAPDLPLERPERGADLDVEVLDESAPNAKLIDAFRHDHGGDERQPPLRRLLAEERKAERVD